MTRVKSDLKHWPFNVISNTSKPKIKVEYKSEKKIFYPEEISFVVQVKMKKITEAYLGKVLICTIFGNISSKRLS
jgi:heat shock protein 1/8